MLRYENDEKFFAHVTFSGKPSTAFLLPKLPPQVKPFLFSSQVSSNRLAFFHLGVC